MRGFLEALEVALRVTGRDLVGDMRIGVGRLLDGGMAEPLARDLEWGTELQMNGREGEAEGVEGHRKADACGGADALLREQRMSERRYVVTRWLGWQLELCA